MLGEGAGGAGTEKMKNYRAGRGRSRLWIWIQWIAWKRIQYLSQKQLFLSQHPRQPAMISPIINWATTGEICGIEWVVEKPFSASSFRARGKINWIPGMEIGATFSLVLSLSDPMWIHKANHAENLIMFAKKKEEFLLSTSDDDFQPASARSKMRNAPSLFRLFSSLGSHHHRLFSSPPEAHTMANQSNQLCVALTASKAVYLSPLHYIS